MLVFIMMSVMLIYNNVDESVNYVADNVDDINYVNNADIVINVMHDDVDDA